MISAYEIILKFGAVVVWRGMSRDTSSGLLGIDRRSVMKGFGAVGIAAALGSSTTGKTDVEPEAEVEAATLPDRHGPYRNNRFLVEIDGIATAGFREVDLPDAVVADAEYREGTDPPTARRLSGINEYDPLVLRKGVTDDSKELFEWFELAQQGQVDEARRSIAVNLLDEAGEVGPRWEFERAWPGRYNGPDLDANARNGIALETLEILHEGMERVA